jgi:hypothetical protein
MNGLYILSIFFLLNLNSKKTETAYQNTESYQRFVGAWEFCGNKTVDFPCLDDSKSFRFGKGGGMQNCNNVKFRLILTFRFQEGQLHLNCQSFVNTETDIEFAEFNNTPVYIDFHSKLITVEKERKYVYKYYFTQANELVLKLNLEETNRANL